MQSEGSSNICDKGNSCLFMTFWKRREPKIGPKRHCLDDKALKCVNGVNLYKAKSLVAPVGVKAPWVFLLEVVWK